MLTGVNIEATVQAGAGADDPGDRLRRAVDSIADIETLCAVEDDGIEGVICGRAIYSGDARLRRGAGARRRARQRLNRRAAAARRRRRRHARQAHHPLPRRHRRPRRQGRQLRRAARRRRSGRDRRALQRAGRRRADLPRHHRDQRRARPDPARSSRRWRRRCSSRSPSAAACARSTTCAGCSTPAPTRSASTRRRSPNPQRDRATRRRKYGAQCIVVAIDAKRRAGDAAGWEVYTHGGRRNTGLDAVEWARRDGRARRRRDPAHQHGPRRHARAASTSR